MGGLGLIPAAGLPDRTQRRYLSLIAEAQGEQKPSSMNLKSLL